MLQSSIPVASGLGLLSMFGQPMRMPFIIPSITVYVLYSEIQKATDLSIIEYFDYQQMWVMLKEQNMVR